MPTVNSTQKKSLCVGVKKSYGFLYEKILNAIQTKQANKHAKPGNKSKTEKKAVSKRKPLYDVVYQYC